MAWLLAGSVALALAGVLMIVRSLTDYERLPRRCTGRSTGAMAAGALAALAVGWLRPAPWLLALPLVAILSVVWLIAVDRWSWICETLSDAPASDAPASDGA